MFGVVVFLGLLGVSLSLDAVVTLHCDNNYVAKASYDGGDTYTQIASGANWPAAGIFSVADVTPNTIVDVECSNEGELGGFIATVAYDEKEYYTDNPITNSIWQTVNYIYPSGPLVYNVKGSTPANIQTPGINDNANWVWNGETWTTMTFRFDFGEICSLSFVGHACSSHADCPQCLVCCNGRHECHERNAGDYIVPTCECNYDVFASTYLEAQAYCKGRYGTGLPTIVTEYDKETFIILMKEAEEEICNGNVDCLARLHSTYIGLNDREEEGNFVWADGTPCEIDDGTCIDYWAEGEPITGDNDNDCVWFNWDTSELSHEEGCDNENHIACNKPHFPFIDRGHDAGMNAMGNVV